MQPSATRYRTLDHWRGIAALAVVFHHTPLYTYESDATVPWGEPAVRAYHLGWWGVPAFFAISGYCVVAAADRAPCVGTYFQRRLRRIYPPYFAALALVLALRVLLPGVWASEPYPVPSPSALTPWAWLGNLTLTLVWQPRLLPEPATALLGPAWTLCYEEGYYLIAGLLLAAFGRRWLFLGVVAVTAGAVAAPRFGVSLHSTPVDQYWYAFAAGAVVYFGLSQPARLWRGLCGLFLAVAVLALAARTPAGGLLAPHATPQAGGVIGGAVALALLALHPLDGRLAGLRPLAPLRWCGERCYSIYLMHWPVCKTAAVFFHRFGLDEFALAWPLATIPLAVFAGQLFHVAVERRFTNVRRDGPESPRPPA